MGNEKRNLLKEKAALQVRMAVARDNASFSVATFLNNLVRNPYKKML
jgi:hypothetical protein